MVAWPCRRIQLQEYTLVGVVLALVVIGTILKPDTFPTADNRSAILTQASVVGVLAIGMTFVIATAGIDLGGFRGRRRRGRRWARRGLRRRGVRGSPRSASRQGLGLVNGAAIAYGKVVRSSPRWRCSP